MNMIVLVPFQAVFISLPVLTDLLVIPYMQSCMPIDTGTCKYTAAQIMTDSAHIMCAEPNCFVAGQSAAAVPADFNRIRLYLVDAAFSVKLQGRGQAATRTFGLALLHCDNVHDTRHHDYTGSASTTLYKPLVWCTVFRRNPVSCKSWLNSSSVRSFPSTATSIVMSSKYFTDRSVMP